MSVHERSSLMFCKSLALAFCGIWICINLEFDSDSGLHQGFGIIMITVLFFKLTLSEGLKVGYVSAVYLFCLPNPRSLY